MQHLHHTPQKISLLTIPTSYPAAQLSHAANNSGLDFPINYPAAQLSHSTKNQWPRCPYQLPRSRAIILRKEPAASRSPDPIITCRCSLMGPVDTARSHSPRSRRVRSAGLNTA